MTTTIIESFNFFPKDVTDKKLIYRSAVKEQKGFNCGSYAIEFVLSYFCCKHSIFGIDNLKKINYMPADSLKEASISKVVAEEIKVEGIGGVLNINDLARTGKYLGVDARVLCHDSYEDFTAMLEQALDNKLPVIVALSVDEDKVLPTPETYGVYAHYAVAVGSYIDKNNTLYIIMTDNGRHYSIDAHTLHLANRNAVCFAKQSFVKHPGDKEFSLYTGDDINKFDDHYTYDARSLEFTFQSRSLVLMPQNYRLASKHDKLEQELPENYSPLQARYQKNQYSQDKAAISIKRFGFLPAPFPIHAYNAIEQHLIKARAEFLEAINDDGIEKITSLFDRFNLKYHSAHPIIASFPLMALDNSRDDVMFYLLKQGVSLTVKADPNCYPAVSLIKSCADTKRYDLICDLVKKDFITEAKLLELPCIKSIDPFFPDDIPYHIGLRSLLESGIDKYFNCKKEQGGDEQTQRFSIKGVTCTLL